MPSALLWVADQLGQAAMERAPPVTVELGLDPGRQEGVAETHALVAQVHDPRSLRRPQPSQHRGRIGGHRLDDRNGRLAEQRNRLEHLANRSRQHGQTRRDQAAERAGNGQSPNRSSPPTRPLERAAELERIERVPPSRAVQLDERGPRKRDAETRPQQAMDGAYAQ